MRLIAFFIFLSTTCFAASLVPSSFTANFEESFVSVTGKVKKSFGKIDYKNPGHIRMEKNEPEPSVFVSNDKMSWYYVPPFIKGEEGQVTVQKSQRLPLINLLDSIKDGIENSKLFSHKFEGKELVLTFSDAAKKELNLKKVIFTAQSVAKDVKKINEFEKLTLIYADDRKVDLKFIDFKENVNFAPKYFIFNIPAKTKITTN